MFVQHNIHPVIFTLVFKPMMKTVDAKISRVFLNFELQGDYSLKRILVGEKKIHGLWYSSWFGKKREDPSRCWIQFITGKSIIKVERIAVEVIAELHAASLPLPPPL
ncbi:hypothetical protein J1N35_021234 [Gossypium stocksii]|uniref:Uncharacterized protein n=1 Tax=Gossypium stocksii TaxID=47602 RepID=A0A9D4A143_9ROSI|nr:hypothetical protein J1N35_021234 [Gossypium stocksii]